MTLVGLPPWHHDSSCTHQAAPPWVQDFFIPTPIQMHCRSLSPTPPRLEPHGSTPHRVGTPCASLAPGGRGRRPRGANSGRDHFRGRDRPGAPVGCGGCGLDEETWGEMGWTFLRILFSGHRLIDTPWIPVANGHGKLIQGDYRIF